MQSGEGVPLAADEEPSDSLTYGQLYADLVSAARNSVPDGAFGFQQFLSDSGMLPSTARRFLDSRVRTGILGTKLITVDGHQRRIYWFLDADAQLGGNSDAAE